MCRRKDATSVQKREIINNTITSDSAAVVSYCSTVIMISITVVLFKGRFDQGINHAYDFEWILFE